MLAAAVWCSFGAATQAGFVNFDDDQYVYENSVVRSGLSAGNLVWAFTHVQVANWHPLTTLSFMADCQFGGGSAAGCHLTNVGLHIATAILLFLVLRAMTSETGPAFFVALVFAVHPLRAESVVWVSERKDVLSGMFFMLTLAAYISQSRQPWSWGRYLPVPILFALGLMAKPILVMLPCVLFLLDYWPLGRFPAARAERSVFRRLIWEKIPLLVMSGVMGIVVYLSQSEARLSAEAMPASMRLSNAVVSYATYLGQMFYPANLAAFYPCPPSGQPPGKIILSLLILAIISILFFRWRRERPYLLVGWLWYGFMLLPVIGILQAGAQARADRYTYLSGIGLGIALAWAAKEWVMPRKIRRSVSGIMGAVIILFLIFAARRQTLVWYDSESLWRHTLAGTSNNAIAESNLATELLRQGRIDETIEHAAEAIRLNPQYAEAHNCLGYAFYQRGQWDNAGEQFLTTLKIKPDFAAAHNNLGLVYLKKRRLSDALAEFQRAIRIQPDSAETQNNLGVALMQIGRAAEAVEHYQIAIKLRRDYVGAENNCAWILSSSTNAAVRDGRKALQLARHANELTQSENIVVLRTLAAAYAEDGQFMPAIETVKQALQLAIRHKDELWVNALRAEMELYLNQQSFRADGRTP